MIHSVTIGPDGLGLISYVLISDPNLPYLRVAHCNDAACSWASTTTLTGAGSSATSRTPSACRSSAADEFLGMIAHPRPPT